MHAQPPISGMTTRWSSKPATHKAERLRNNQRRHRERARCRVAELEARLEDTQLRLKAALARIAELSEELRLATTECRRSAVRGARSVHLDGQGLSGKALGGAGGDEPIYSEASTRSSSPSRTAENPPADRSGAVGGFPIPQEPPAKDPTKPSSSPPSSCPPSPAPLLWPPPARGPAAAPESGGRDDCQCAGDGDGDGDDLPPPVPGESTSLCGEAFAMIAQLNYGGLEVSAISRCLRPGFRREAVPGGGCRVENGVLFSVLDFISSS